MQTFKDAADLDDVVTVVDWSDPMVNVEVRNDQLVAVGGAAAAGVGGERHIIAEQMWQLLVKAVVTASGQVRTSRCTQPYVSRLVGA